MTLKRHAIAAGLICIFVAAAYGNALWNGFALDDVYIVEKNPLIRRISDIPTLFATHYWEGASAHGEELSLALYRPMVLTTYTLNYVTTGLAAWAFHLTNILIHLGVVLTLYGLGCRLGLGWSAALAATLVFAVHPLNTEAVTSIVGRAELLMTLGVLLAFYWDLAKNPASRLVTRLSVASVVAFALGILSKEQAILLPILLIIVDGMRGDDLVGRRWGRILWNGRLRYTCYLMVSAIYLVARTTVIGTTLPPPSNLENPLSVIDRTLSLINAIKVSGTYLWLTVWPANLSADYSYNAITLTHSALDPTVWGSALVWILLLVLGAVAFFRRHRPLALGLTITFLFFLPAANIVVFIGTIMGERLFYLPVAGLSLAFGAAWDRVTRMLSPSARARWGLTVGVGAAILLLAPLTLRTIARNRDWESNETLFASTVRARPGNAKAHVMMAGVHHRRGDLKQALEEYRAALTILPRYTELAQFARDYGRLLTDLGRVDEALAVMKAALRTDPVTAKDPFIYRALAKAHEQNKAFPMAEAALKRAIEIEQSLPRTSVIILITDYGQLARVYTLRGKTAEGRRVLETSMELLRKDERLSEGIRAGVMAQILGNLALIDTLEGNYERAEQRYSRVLQLLESPLVGAPIRTRIARLRDYARLLRKMGRETEAKAIDEKAASLESPP
jgi:protein O-mannosyl-transferase